MRRVTLSIAQDQRAQQALTGAWMSIEEAAAFLSMPVRVLRESLARKARTEGETVEAHLDGIIGRKLGRRWKVWLAGKWTAPDKAERPGGARPRSTPAAALGHGGEESSS